MTHLELCVDPFNEDMLQCLGQWLGSGQALRSVKVACCGDSEEEGWTRGLTGLPKRGLYEFRCDMTALHEGCDDVVRIVEGQGFVVEEHGAYTIRFRYPEACAEVAASTTP